MNPDISLGFALGITAWLLGLGLRSIFGVILSIFKPFS